MADGVSEVIRDIEVHPSGARMLHYDDYTKIYLDVAEAEYGQQIGEMWLRTHSVRQCATDETCVIHKPSDHHMRAWKMNWRGDRGLMERTCEHGVGHPDPDALAYRIAMGRYITGYSVEHFDYLESHGCDGCCVRPDPATINDLINESYNR